MTLAWEGLLPRCSDALWRKHAVQLPTKRFSEPVDTVQVLHRLDEAVGHRLLAGAQRHARVVILLVWLLGALGVADLSLQVALLSLVELQQALPVGPLCVRVHIHLYHAVGYCLVNVGLLGSRTAVEDKEEGLLNAELATEVLLKRVEEVRLELHVARLVHAVDVSEGCSNCELVRDRRQRVPHQFRVLWRGIELVTRDTRVVHAILYAASNANLHLQDQVHGRHFLKIFGTNCHVLLVGLLGEVEHVRAEERLAMGLEVFCVSLKHAIKPREELLRAVVRVDDHWDAIGRGDVTHVVRTCTGAED
mmetsp:Transcript_130347/g.316665  ORF Transcript_130347/g.316665 Transcript_130347/m.316665 type:complete len:306 (-) Transcript_130347:343-1260(-)